MNTLATRIASCAGLVCLAAWSPTAGEIAFAPSKGASLAKNFTIAFELKVDDLRLNVDGEEIDPSMMGNLTLTVGGESTIAVVDRYADSADGRPLRLVRAFEDLASALRFQADSDEGSEQGDVPAASELEGTRVVFAWNEAESRYDATYDEEAGGPAELLEGLSEDMDLRALLPGNSVSTGDTWEIDPAKLADVFFPGGNLGFAPEGAEDEVSAAFLEELDLDQQAFFAKLLLGKVTATYRGDKTEDGVELAEVAIEVDIASSTDLSDIVRRAIDAAIQASGEDVPVEFSIDKAVLELALNGAGTLLWNAGSGHVHSLELKVDDTLALDAAISVDVGGEEHQAAVTCELSGTQSVELSTESR